jgi:hypothetical protein
MCWKKSMKMPNRKSNCNSKNDILYSKNTKQCRNESGRFDTLKSDSTHHFFRNACTKSGSLLFSQFSCWLILSVYILMSFDFPFGRLFGVRNFGITLIHKTLHRKKKKRKRKPTKTGSVHRYSEKVISFCSRSGTCRVTYANNPVIVLTFCGRDISVKSR